MSGSRFERMVAISEDEYKALKAMQSSTEPLMNRFSTLNTEYNKQNLEKDSYSRIHRQGEILEALKEVKDNIRDKLIDATPKVYQTRASSLYTFISDKMNINENGGLKTLPEGILLNGSNINDLIQYAVRDRRSNVKPIGWEYFLQELVKNDVAPMLLNYETLEEIKFIKNNATVPKTTTTTTRTTRNTVRQVKKKSVDENYLAIKQG